MTGVQTCALPIYQAASQWTNGVLIHVDAQTAGIHVLDELKTVLEMNPGECEAFLKISIDADTPPVVVKLGQEYMTANDPVFFEQVEKITGKGSIETRCAVVREKVKKKQPWKRKKVANGSA